MDLEQATQTARAHTNEGVVPIDETLYFKREAALFQLGNRIEAITDFEDHENPNVRTFEHTFPINEYGDELSLDLIAHYNFVTGHSSRPRSATEIKAVWRANGSIFRIEDTSICKNRAEEAEMFALITQSVEEAEKAHFTGQQLAS